MFPNLHTADDPFYTMMANSPCSIAVNMHDSVTLACQDIRTSSSSRSTGSKVQETLSGSSADSQQLCSVKSVRWRRLELPGRQFTNLTTESSSSKFITWSADAIGRHKTTDGSAETHSTVSYLRVTSLREADLSR